MKNVDHYQRVLSNIPGGLKAFDELVANKHYQQYSPV